MDRLTEIRSRREKATPGEWGRVADPCHYDTLSSIVAGGHGVAEVGGLNAKEQDANAAFIASAPSDIDWLIARVEALEADRDGAGS